jgi:hypothetical protein
METIMSIELKVKAKSLAAEARIIKIEEIKQRNYGRHLLRTQGKSEPSYENYHSLRGHRLWLRGISRSTGLARAYLKGMSYKRVEATTTKSVPIDEIARLASKYGDARGVSSEAIIRWVAPE